MPALNLALVMLLAPAQAARTVVHDGAGEATRARVEAVAEEPVRWLDLGEATAEHPPAAIGAAEVRGCSGNPWAPGALAEARRQGQSHLDYGEDALAAGVLEEHLGALACAVEVVDAGDLAWLYLVQGWAAQQAGDAEAARLAWSRSRRADPSLGWPATLGAEDPAHGALMAEPATLPSRAVSLSPGPAAVAVWVNGRPVSGALQLDQDWNLIQLGEPVRGVWVRTPSEGLAGVVVPQATPGSGVAWVTEEAARWDLSVVLSQVVDDAGPVWVVAEDEVWQGTPGSEAWRPVDLAGRDTRGRPVLLLAGGGVALAGGAALAAVSYTAGLRLSQSSGTFPTEEAYDRALTAHGRWQVAWYGGLGLGVAGLAATTTGLLLGRQARLVVVPVPGGVQVVWVGGPP